jgi:hypothetical protein
MSLNFDFTDMVNRVGKEEFDRITDHPDPDNKSWHPVTDSLIWLCMIVGVPGIHGKYIDKMIDRAAAVQGLLSGGYLMSQQGKIAITAEDIRAHEGLKTNVSFDSDAKFYAKLFRMAKEEGERAGRLQGMSAYDRILQIRDETKAA